MVQGCATCVSKCVKGRGGGCGTCVEPSQPQILHFSGGEVSCAGIISKIGYIQVTSV